MQTYRSNRFVIDLVYCQTKTCLSVFLQSGQSYCRVLLQSDLWYRSGSTAVTLGPPHHSEAFHRLLLLKHDIQMCQ